MKRWIVVAFLVAAVITGLSCVLFMWAFEAVLDWRLDSHLIGNWYWLTTPIIFILAKSLIERFAPFAAGTGIPQAIFVANKIDSTNQTILQKLISPLTVFIKVITLLLIIWAGASSGREGPTVHVATGIFWFVLVLFRKFKKIKFDMRSAIVAGGASGLAAAFNTPLAGVTFAIEELTPDYFSTIKDFVLMSIIIAAITAQAMTGNYTYFGRLLDAPSISLFVIIIISLLCGLMGAAFSSALLSGQSKLAPFYRHPKAKYLLPVFFSLGILLLAKFFGDQVMGPGNLVAKSLLNNGKENYSLGFSFAKIFSTLFTYWSGVAGGIFAPCLSIGAALGSTLSQWLHAPISSCALIGMVAFLAGTIQAPITAFVIIYEMTGDHAMLLPLMLASLIALLTARATNAKHLYKALAENYSFLLEDKTANKDV